MHSITFPSSPQRLLRLPVSRFRYVDPDQPAARHLMAGLSRIPAATFAKRVRKPPARKVIMKNASLLILVSGSAKAEDLDSILQSADAERMHLSFLVLGGLPRTPIYSYGTEAYGIPMIPDIWQEEIETATAGLTETAKMIEARLDASGATGDVDTLACDIAALPAIVGQRAATCDAVVISDDLRGNDSLFRNAVQGVLFQSPSGVILNATRAASALHPTRIFIAWDTGLPAARAVHAALPLLKEASHVTIAVFDPVTSQDRYGENPGSDVARWLSHHGCHVDLQQYPSGGEEIGTCIQKRATETGADLIVMGAYGHSRMRQAVFGGTTKSMVEQTDRPVMLAH